MAGHQFWTQDRLRVLRGLAAKGRSSTEIWREVKDRWDWPLTLAAVRGAMRDHSIRSLRPRGRPARM